MKRYYQLAPADEVAAEEVSAPALACTAEPWAHSRAQEDEPEPGPAADESESDEEAAAPARTLRRGLRGSVSLSSSGADAQCVVILHMRGTHPTHDPPEDGEDEDDDVGDVDEDISSGEEGVIAQFVGQDEHVELGDRTRRLAVVDLDWERIRAVDIFAVRVLVRVWGKHCLIDSPLAEQVLRSFLPAGGTIRSVTVYPSDFGLQRMAEEEVDGPQAAFDEDADSDAEVDPERLRKYERDRLRYHYAVVECDSVATAAAVYDGCDGLEFERSSTKLDLRFVADDQSFAGRKVRDVATEVPASYKPVEYTAKALQQTRVQLTWDADDPDRTKALRRKVTADQLKEEDFAAYLGSGSEDDGEERPESAQEQAQARRQRDGQHLEAARLRALLLGDAAAVARADADADDGEEDDDGDDLPAAVYRKPRAEQGGDMVVTFGKGLEERMAAKRAQAAGEVPEETVWQAHLRERKAKRMAVKHAAKAAAVAADDAGFDDPFFTTAAGATDFDAFGEQHDAEAAAAGGARKKKGKQAAAGAPDEAAERELRRRRAELELLLMDDSHIKAGRLDVQSAGAQGGAAAVPGEGRQSRKQARAAAKAARAAARRDGDEDGDAAGLDTSDPRFAALFSRPDFALDPTDPRMKAMRSADLIQAKRRDPQAGRDDGDDLNDAVARLKKRRKT
jgi:hypothetical protein